MKAVAVIGAGAAGCFCAARLARLDPSCRITLFEAHKKPLAKVAVTGGGRCNLTNTFEGVEDLSRVYPRGASLMKRALRQFGWKDIWAWMQEQGVALVAQEDHCVFPRSQDAMQIVRTLLYALHRPGVEIRTNCAISAIEPLPEGFLVRWEGGSAPFDAVVVTTGGSPRRSGLSFLDPLALEMEAPVPSLYTFALPDDPVRSLTGLVVEPVAVSLSGTRFNASGTLLITDWGMSGPAILKLSSYAARYLAERSWQAELSVNWAPDEDARACVDALLDAAPQKQVGSVHPAFLPARLWRHLVEKAGIALERRCAEVGSKGRNRLDDGLAGSRGDCRQECGIIIKECLYLYAKPITNMIKKINEAVAYIGTDDVDLDLFESQYEVPEGMAYNSYLIQDEKVAIMDTVDARCADAWKENLAEALGDRTPDYLVVHHLEPDHTGLIDWVTRRYPALQVVASTRALQMMGQFFDGLDLTGRSLAVKEGDTLALGGRSLTFYGAPMVHWPEVMVSWLDADRILFSADAFGKFGALSKCGYFSEEDGDWACEARRYYFNICGKYGLQVQALLKKVLPLPLDTICPLHGPVLRGDLAPYTGLYDTWSRYGVETEGVFVAYASIHGGTAAAALKMADILRAKGCPKVAVADLSRDDQAEAVEDAFRYGKAILAASSYDAGVFPPMDIFLHHLRDKAWQKRRVGLIENGSWAPSAGRVMREQLSAMKEMEVVEPTVTLRSRMKDSDLAALEALADAILA